MFDHSKLSETDKIILTDFFVRRSFFNNYILENHLGLHTCPGCGYPTLSERGGYEICNICNWEDDNQDNEEADKIWGGPNGKLSLTENRINIGKILDSGKTGTLHLDKFYAESVLKSIEHFEKTHVQYSVWKRKQAYQLPTKRRNWRHRSSLQRQIRRTQNCRSKISFNRTRIRMA